MSRSRILVVSERYWPDGGGGELATHSIVRVLGREFEVKVVTGSRNPFKSPGVEYIYEPLLSRWEKPALWFNSLRLIRTRRFEEILRKSDVVYIPRFAFPVIPYAKSIGKEVVVHLHGYIPISYTATILAPYEEHKRRIIREDIVLECLKGPKYCVGANLLWWLPRLARRWILQADRIVCVSRRQAEIVLDRIPELENKIEVVYNPLPSELVNAKPVKELEDTPTFLYVGGDSYVKGFPILLQALKELGKQGVKARFILTGTYNPSSIKLLKRLSETCKLEIQVMGRVKYRDIIELHKQVWALVFPSILEETFGYAVLEAALLGTIPIASRVGGVVEILDNTTASTFMFMPCKVDELIKKVKYVYSLSTSEVKILGYRLREEVLKRFNPIKLEKEVLRVFVDVIE